MTLNHLSLFSGIEGFAIGLRLVGLDLRTVGYVEQDEWCQKVLQSRIAEGVLDYAPIIRDIRTADFRPMAGLVDIVTAGFPCQPHSIAGLRAGDKDERNLWPDTARVIGEVRPGYVLLENAGIQLRKGSSPAYAYTVLAELAALGYDAEWGIVSAKAAGAPHVRERWFCFAHLDSKRQLQSRRCVSDVGSRSGYRSTAAADAHGARREEQRAIAGQPPFAAVDLVTPHAPGLRCRKAINGPREWHPNPEGSVAVHEWWVTEPDVVRMVHGFPGRVDRIRALGNGIVPAVVAEFLKMIAP